MRAIGLKNFNLWLVLALIWSSSYFAIKIGVRDMSPLILVSLRMLIGTAILFGFLWYRSLGLPMDRQSMLIYMVSGVMGSALPFTLISYGELYIDSGLSALLMGIAPVATVLLAPLAHSDERLTTNALMGIGFGFVGLVFLFGPASFDGVGQHFFAQVAIFFAALCYAFTTLFVRKYAKLPALQLACGSMMVGMAMVVVVTAFVITPAQMVDQISWSPSLIAVMYLGVFPTAIATLIYFYLVPQIGAAKISQVNFVVPVVGALLGVVILEETMSWNQVLAMLMVVAAVYLVSKTSAQNHAP